jgi:uncharacterized glyoxalase superfamily protein PhnB
MTVLHSKFEIVRRKLSNNGSASAGMQQMPWAYWGCTLDRYGIRWMLNCYTAASEHALGGTRIHAT